jgi:uncharacterized membrane protein (GlpM family)
MLPDPLFWYGLALKMAMTATIVVVASVAVERSGPFIGALIAALPTAAGAAYIIMALEHPPAFIAASAVGSAAANAAVAIFALTYAALAQRQGIVLSITGATLVWFAAAAALRLVDWTAPGALLLNALVFAITIPASARYRRAVDGRAGGRGGDHGEPRDRLVRLRHVRRVPDRDGEFRGDLASARRRTGGGRCARACGAGAGRPWARLPRAALSRRSPRGVVGFRRRSRHRHGVERDAVAAAAGAGAGLAAARRAV